MNNRQIAKLLHSVAAAYEVKGESQFKIVAYERAATAIEHATSEVKDLWDDQQLTSLPGIGANIASHLDELFRTGKVKHFQQVMKSLPPAMFVLIDLPGIGAKTAFKLCQKLKIYQAKDAYLKLKKAAKEGKIAKLEGFGEQSEKVILETLKGYKKKEERMLLPFASQLADKLINYMKQEKAVVRIDPLGSLRRKAATVGDIDLAVATRKSKQVIDHFVKYPDAKEVVAAGQNTARINLQSNHQIDLKTQEPESYGALLQHYTGSKQHNIHLREIAQKKGWSLSEYGIKKGKGHRVKIQKFSQEGEFYQALSMDWIPPELREDVGEIEAAQKHQLPKLIDLKDIKGDLHVHSDFPIEPSHDLGADSMKLMAQKAQELGYEYLGFSEHNPSQSQHSTKKIIDIIKRKKEVIDKLNYSFNKSSRKHKLRLINGLEVDIKPDGKLALPEAAIKILDFAIASIHASFKMPEKEMTKRVLASLEHPKVKILGHPTGRKLGEREGFELNWDKIFAFCKKYDKWLEINAWPDRLDLPDSLVRETVKNGVKIVINTDSHALDQMNLMTFGISVAKRGWAKKSDIINTLSWSKLNARLR